MNATTQTDRWSQPTPVDDVTMAFGGNALDLMPPMSEIPKEFTRQGNRWVKFQSDWFYCGITHNGLRAKDGIDLTAAMRHLGTIQRSFEPKHEHKEAAVAYLASRWLDDRSTWERVK